MKSILNTAGNQKSPKRPKHVDAKASPKPEPRRKAAFAEKDEIAFFAHDSAQISRTSSFSSASSTNRLNPNHNVSAAYADALGHCVVRDQHVIWPNGQRYEGPRDRSDRPHGKGRVSLSDGRGATSLWKHGQCISTIHDGSGLRISDVQHHLAPAKIENNSLANQLRRLLNK